jgi:hypothetical protein
LPSPASRSCTTAPKIYPGILLQSSHCLPNRLEGRSGGVDCAVFGFGAVNAGQRRSGSMARIIDLTFPPSKPIKAFIGRSQAAGNPSQPLGGRPHSQRQPALSVSARRRCDNRQRYSDSVIYDDGRDRMFCVTRRISAVGARMAGASIAAPWGATESTSVKADRIRVKGKEI